MNAAVVIDDDKYDWVIGLKRFQRLRDALGYTEAVAIASDVPYEDICREFGAISGRLFGQLAQPEYSWMDGDHILTLYKAWQIRHD